MVVENQRPRTDHSDQTAPKVTPFSGIYLGLLTYLNNLSVM